MDRHVVQFPAVFLERKVLPLNMVPAGLYRTKLFLLLGVVVVVVDVTLLAWILIPDEIFFVVHLCTYTTYVEVPLRTVQDRKTEAS